MIFWAKLAQKGYFQSKKEIKKENYIHRILYIQISLGTKFHLKQTILIFRAKFIPTGYLRSKGRKSEHRHCILRIRISLSTKFHFKETILNFGTKFAKRGYFQSRTEKVNIRVQLKLSISIFFDQIFSKRAFPL